ncbi:protein of unknown function DUF427 [Parvibaculum lavamentivorans DS-1]|uniref:DUF427 domain-containing protein n=1 Tax=Parvibaculum lavamentivorans (strain DS-1 / DSM 13023 / NCIMB 13966) TaxID=402881 RepID=A7HWE3_PARL1|nr:DUF427 domain-containing protein [Parvibaculum lavamentivorans]ABS64226.1 protein of unknown function DUF427 [Parvibaculum lavamentivorans DS-1]
MGQLMSGKEHKSGYESHPGHLLRLMPAGRRVRVRFNGELLADSTRALELFEGEYAPVFYLPREDVKMELLTPTKSVTWCPFKGEASYWSLEGEGGQDAVWSYEDPFVEMAEIKDYLAFYPNKVEFEVEPA